MTNSETTYVASVLARLDAEGVDRALALLDRIVELCPTLLDAVLADRADARAGTIPAAPLWAEILGELQGCAQGGRIELLQIARRMTAPTRGEAA